MIRNTVAALLAALVVSTSVTTARAENPVQGQLARPKLLASYAAGEVRCGPVGNPTFVQKVTRLVTVYYYSEHDRRLWINVDGGDIVLGMGETCQFTGVRSSPLN